MTKSIPPLMPSAVPWVPLAYMKRAVKFLLEHAAAGLFLDPGLRKTSITLAAFKLLQKKGVAHRALVIAPLKACTLVWPKEVAKWKDFEHLRVEVLHGPKKDQALAREADLYVINPEGLEWLTQATKVKDAKGRTRVAVDVKRFQKLGFDTLVVDELSKFKHPRSLRFKILKTVLGTFARRWGLTGSPASNSLMDLFGQAFVLDLGHALGRFITHFRTTYFVPGYDGFSWNLQDDGEERIYKRLSPLVLRMAADDYLELPTIIPNNILVDLPPPALRTYLELEKDLITDIDARVVTAANAGAALTKLRQVANGGLYLDPETRLLVRASKKDREVAHLHHEKTDALVDLIEELQGSPLLVAYDFAHDLSRLREKLGKDVPYIGSGVNAAKLKQVERDWNAGKLPVLLGHPQSMAHGLNLQEAGNHVAWYALTWDYELYDQFIKRVRRSGNTHKRVFVHHLLARGTIDETILASLRNKERGQQALFDGLKRLARSRSR